MIKVKVKSIWQGKVEVRDKYIARALELKKGLLIEHQSDFMIILYEKIDRELITPKEPVMVKDHYSGEFHQLFYFKWRPNRKQGKLL